MPNMEKLLTTQTTGFNQYFKRKRAGAVPNREAFATLSSKVVIIRPSAVPTHRASLEAWTLLANAFSVESFAEPSSS